MTVAIEFGSVCSGIEAASVAWHPLGWCAAWLAEIEAFPSAVLAHHYPDTPNLGDMTTIARRVLAGEVAAPDVFTGGTPCQAFSVAGLRKSLDDDRGNLSLKFVGLADAIDHVRGRAGKPAAIIVWENVPGVLSTKDNAFGCFLAGLAGEDDELQPPGRRWEDAGAVYGPRRAVAWRTLDAQYFGLAQRRRRVFVVASARDDVDPAAVLFEWEGLRRDTAPRREAGEESAAGTLRSTDGGSCVDHARAQHLIGDVVGALTAACGPNGHGGSGLATDKGAAAGHLIAFGGNNTAGPVDVATACNAHGGAKGRPSPTLAKGAHPPAIAFSSKDHGADASADLAPTLRAMGHDGSHANGGGQMAVQTAMQVRRLTPRECERLQGFPEDYTRIPSWTGWRKLDVGEDPEQLRAEGLEVKQNKKTGRWRVKDVDGPRYKALGNSWAVPCARWIGARIDAAMRP